jgi:hypothetical protein
VREPDKEMLTKTHAKVVIALVMPRGTRMLRTSKALKYIHGRINNDSARRGMFWASLYRVGGALSKINGTFL